ncbi:hypothetical protein ASG31_12265 [Chryseobacterium sp. Leaf404]|uniref:helix-turn-helix domain-containing protein n=1 Tax=unclassified Chryseobacterium TaxID=2593645 RepID=UPI0006FBF637|nr:MULTISPECIES: helix-turn-helix domain-containing protein [unclassified Chryseobacterium]KQT17116.1 hypothetical protein ASG31_12265 [Chryseobacterium sp. Leaf404]
MKKKSISVMEETNVLSIVVHLLCEIRDLLQQNRSQDEELVDTADAKRLLNKSDSALYRMRKNGEIPWKKIGRKIYYPKSFFTNAFNS